MANKTVTVRPSGQGGTYTSLAAAIAGEVAANANLVTMAGILTISIEGDWSGGADTTAVNVTGFTTNASYYVNIVTNAANKAGTSWSASKYILSTNSSTNALALSNNYSRVTGLQAKSTSTGSPIRVNNGSIVSACFALGGNSPISIEVTAASNICILVNCIAVGGTYDGIGAQNGGANKFYCYNCVSVRNGRYGIYTSQYNAQVLKNCYSGGNTGADYYDSTGTATTRTTCFSEDGTESTSTAEYSTSAGAYFTNIGSGTENLAIGSSSTLIAAGTDLRADATFDFDYDIVGTTRGASWDVGAFEYVSAGGISIPVVMHHLRMQGAL